MRLKKAVALFAIGSALTPGAALGQSAGDDQYADPFNNTTAQSHNPGSSSGDPGSSGSAGAGTSVAQPAAPSDTRDLPTGQLPVTGLNVIPIFIAGAILLLAGVAIRRVNTRPLYARR